MKNRIIIITIILISVISLTACNNSNKKNYGLEFKNEYESLNGKTNKNGAVHRTITIPEDNPYIKVEPSKVVEMIDNKESFFLYVGDPLCPWCRSVLEKSIEVAKKYNINKIYYIEIWDNEGKEIFRDKFEYVDGESIRTLEGTKEYYRLLKEFDEVLEDYEYVIDNGKTVTTGEKRIYAPNYFYIKDGKVVKMIKGYSELQTNSREVLTEEMLKDEEEQFTELFKLQNECKDKSC